MADSSKYVQMLCITLWHKQSEIGLFHKRKRIVG
jgi:hypothetical protein